jgi:hypothetical protein
VDKLLLMSVIFATVVIPALASRLQSPKRGLKQAIILMFLFNFCYMIAMIKVWPRLLG